MDELEATLRSIGTLSETEIAHVVQARLEIEHS